MTNTCPASSSTSTMVWHLLLSSKVSSLPARFPLLCVVLVQVSSKSSTRCIEQGGEIELRDTMSLSSLALGEPPSLGCVIIGALNAYTSEISLPGRVLIPAKKGDPQGVL